MAGYESHDGKLAGNRQIVETYDKSHWKTSKRLQGVGGGKPGAGKAEDEHDEGGGDHEEIKSVVEEHGPAHKVEVAHDHEGGRHHVTSHHADGHKHGPVTHGSAAMAHAHAAHAAGVHDTDELSSAHAGGDNMGDEGGMGADMPAHEEGQEQGFLK
jgi:hypothetical protein